MALDQRQQKQVVFGALFVLAAGFYWYTFYRPQQVELVRQRLIVDTLKIRVAEIKKIRGTQTVKSLKEEAERYARELAAMRQLVPSENEVPALLDNVAAAARRAGLDLSDIAPAGVFPGTYFDVYRYKLKISGPYHKIANFFTNIASLQRIIVPMNVSLLAPSNNATAIKRARPNEAVLDATFEIQTYVAKAGIEPGGRGKPGGM
jgi:type IV pilus assembly protein PilO